MALEDTLRNKDITETGPLPLEGIKGLNQKVKRQDEEFTINQSQEQQIDPFKYGASYFRDPYKSSTSRELNEGERPYGTSKFDSPFTSLNRLEHLDDMRARNQSDFSKLSNGILKGVTTYGTTFANGTVGLVWGMFRGVGNVLDDDPNTSFASGLWNNAFNRNMNWINEKMEEILPNYYTDDEREHPMAHVFSANFVGDKVIKNLGFMYGALHSAVAFGGIYGGIGKALSGIAKGAGMSAEAASGLSGAASSLISHLAAATTEGTIEALQGAEQMSKENEDFYINQRDYNKRLIEDDFTLSPEEKALRLQQEDDNCDAALAKLEESKAKAGNTILGFNIPLLAAGNVIMFNKMLTGGFRTASRAAKVTGKLGELKPGGVFEKTPLQKALKAYYTSGHTEGREEMLQQMISDAANTRYSMELNDYYKAIADPDSNSQASDYISGVGKQLLETLGREDTWEQYLIGSMTGVMGSPVFGKKKTETRADFGKGKKVGWAGGVFGQYKDISEDRDRDEKIVDYLNNQAKDPAFRDKYQRLVRHLYFQNKMDRALDEGLEKEFKDSEFAQLYNDIMWFSYAGKKNELKDMVNSALSNITEEEAQKIVEETTSREQNADGKTVNVGAFIDNNGSRLSTKEIREKVDKDKKSILNLIDSIEKEYASLDKITNGRLSDEQLEQLTYMKLQIKDWKDRTKSVGEDVKTFLESLKNQYQGYQDIAKMALEDNPNSKTAKEEVENIETIKKRLDILTANIIGYTEAERSGRAENKKVRAAINGAIRIIDKLSESGDVSGDEKQKVLSELNDIAKMAESSAIFNDRLEKYFANPDLILNDREEAIKAMEKAELDERATRQMQRVIDASNIKDFTKAVEGSDDSEAMSKAIDSMANSENIMAKQYKSNQAVAKRQMEKLSSLVGKEIPALKSTRGKVTVTQEDIDLLDKVIEYRRIHTNPKISGTASIVDNESNTKPFLDDFTDIWGQEPFNINSSTPEGEALIKRLNDIFHYVAEESDRDRKNEELMSDEPIEVGDESETLETVGKDDVTTVKAKQAKENKAKEEYNPVDEPNPELATSEELNKQFEDELKNADTSNDITQTEGGKKTEWKSNMPEFDVDYRIERGELIPPGPKKGKPTGNRDIDKERDIETDSEGKPVSFEVHRILSEAGAFEYVNSGKLKKNAEIRFVIDPKYAESITDDKVRKQVEEAIWLVTPNGTPEGQLIGILPQARNILDEYENLSEFYNDVVSYWRNNGKGRLVSGNSTKVAELRKGFVKYEKGKNYDLSDIFKTKVPKFTVRETTTSYGTVKSLHIALPSITGREAFPYIQTLTLDELMKSDKFKKSEFYKHFHDSIASVIVKIQENHRDYSEPSDDEARELALAISEFIYTRYRKANEIKVNPRAGVTGVTLKSGSLQPLTIDIYKEEQESGALEYGEEENPRKIVNVKKLSADTVADKIIYNLSKFAPTIRVAYSKMNNDGYMKERFDAGVFSSNISSPYLADEWFTIEPMEKVGGKWQMKNKPQPNSKEAIGDMASAAVEASQERKDNPVPEAKKEDIPTPNKPVPPRRLGKKLDRIVDKKDWIVMKKEEEMAWLDKALPQLKEEDRIEFTKGLIEAATKGKKSWGQLNKGIMRLSDIAAEGTVYHEAFHVVFNMILNESEKQALYKSARTVFGDSYGEVALEEKMAEEFRKYVMHMQDNTKPKSLGDRINKFFKSLWVKVKNWVSPTMYSYFSKINEGYYANFELSEFDGVREREYDLTDKTEKEAYDRLMEIWNAEKGSYTYYIKDGKPIPVKIIKRGNTVAEFWFDTREELDDFENYWRRETGTDFSRPYFIRNVGKWRSYMYKPKKMSMEDIMEKRQLTEPKASPFDKLADYEKSELTARGYTKEEFDSLEDYEQEALRECFFTM